MNLLRMYLKLFFQADGALGGKKQISISDYLKCSLSTVDGSRVFLALYNMNTRAKLDLHGSQI
jgi:hypothetical protein